MTELFCTAVDMAVYQRLTPNVEPALKEKTSKDMDAFANGVPRMLSHIGFVTAFSTIANFPQTYWH